MNTIPSPPPERDLPPGRHRRRRAELLAVIDTEQRSRTRSQARNRRYAPLATAAAVTAILAGAVAGEQLLDRRPPAAGPTAGPTAKTLGPDQVQRYLMACMARGDVRASLRRAGMPASASSYQPVLGVTDPSFDTSRQALVVARAPDGRAAWCYGSTGTTVRLQMFAAGSRYDLLTRSALQSERSRQADESASTAVGAGNVVAAADWISHRDLVMIWGTRGRAVARITVQYNGGPENEARLTDGAWADARRVPERPAPPPVPVPSRPVPSADAPASALDARSVEQQVLGRYPHLPVIRAYGADGTLLARVEPSASCTVAFPAKPTCRYQNFPPGVVVSRSP